MATYDRLRRATSINHDVTMMFIGILRLGVNSTVAPRPPSNRALPRQCSGVVRT